MFNILDFINSHNYNSRLNELSDSELHDLLKLSSKGLKSQKILLDAMESCRFPEKELIKFVDGYKAFIAFHASLVLKKTNREYK